MSTSNVLHSPVHVCFSVSDLRGLSEGSVRGGRRMQEFKWLTTHGEHLRDLQWLSRQVKKALFSSLCQRFVVITSWHCVTFRDVCASRVRLERNWNDCYVGALLVPWFRNKFVTERHVLSWLECDSLTVNAMPLRDFDSMTVVPCDTLIRLIIFYLSVTIFSILRGLFSQNGKDWGKLRNVYRKDKLWPQCYSKGMQRNEGSPHQVLQPQWMCR